MGAGNWDHHPGNRRYITNSKNQKDVKEVMMEEKLRTAFELLFEETTASTTELVKSTTELVKSTTERLRNEKTTTARLHDSIIIIITEQE